MATTPKPQAKIACPRCGNTQCERIPRSNIVKMIFPESTKHFKCEKCFKKFYKSVGEK